MCRERGRVENTVYDSRERWRKDKGETKERRGKDGRKETRVSVRRWSGASELEWCTPYALIRIHKRVCAPKPLHDELPKHIHTGPCVNKD